MKCLLRSSRYCIPRLYELNTKTAQHSGVEGITIKFDWSYNLYTKSAKSRRGLNGVWITSTANCYMHDVEVVDSDIGIAVDYSAFITLRNVNVSISKTRAQPKREYWNDGEVGIAFNEGTSQSIVEGFFVQGL